MHCRFDVGFSAAQAPKNHGVGGVAREAALLHKVASTKSMSILTGPDAAPSGFRPTSSFGRANTGTNRRVLQVGMQPEASGKFLYLVPRDFSALDHAFSRSASAVDDPQLPRQLQRKLSRKSSVKHTRHLYLMGLRGMLAEMRAVRPPGTPYGHTQQLKPKFAMGQGARNKVSTG